MYEEFADKVVIVTGATKGLGRAIADGFARYHPKLVITSRNQAECDAVADEIGAATGRRPLPVACDMSVEAQIDHLVAATHEQLGPVSVVVNNAGFNPGPSMDALNQDLFTTVFLTNVYGPVHLIEAVIPGMVANGGGSVVNVTTVGAYRGAFPVSVYGASKAALLNYTQSLAMQHSTSGIRVNAVSPGPFRTPMMDGLAEAIPGFYDFAAQNNEMKRIGDPVELVPSVLYLASNHASFVTGEDHVVAGGFFR